MSQAQGVHGFSIGVTQAPGHVVVSVRGDLDAATAPLLRDTLDGLIDGGGVRELVVDMEGITFIDSAGIYVLVQALKQVRSGGRDLTLSGASRGAHKVLDVCGRTSVFDLPGPPGRLAGSNRRGRDG